METKLKPPRFDDRFEYAGLHGCESFCRIRVWKVQNGATYQLVVMFTELPENPGTSVTNYIEQLAVLSAPLVANFIDDVAISPGSFTWLEHYPERDRGLPTPESFDRVELEWHTNAYSRRLEARRPQWKRLTTADLVTLGIAEAEVSEGERAHGTHAS
jgi:hypothetical protein